MNHIGDTNKMVGDTPRTEAEVNRQKCWSDDLITIDANFACQLERELNAANQIIRQQQLLEEENLRLKDKIAQLYAWVQEQKQRIKRLEEAGDSMAEWLENPRNLGADACLSHAWREAKEAKP